MFEIFLKEARINNGCYIETSMADWRNSVIDQTLLTRFIILSILIKTKEGISQFNHMEDRMRSFSLRLISSILTIYIAFSTLSTAQTIWGSQGKIPPTIINELSIPHQGISGNHPVTMGDRNYFSKISSLNGWVITEMLNDRWNGGSWEHETKSTYTYNTNGYSTEYLFQTWSGSVWSNATRDSNILDVNGKITTQYKQTWNGAGWIDSSKLTYSYNTDGYNIEILSERWIGSKWEFDSKQTNIFDANGHPTEMLHQNWMGIDWANDSRELITYNFFGSITEYIRQTWDTSDWMNVFRNTSSYDISNFLIESHYQNWSGGIWVDMTASYYTYDDNEHIIEVLTQRWNGSTWINSNRTSQSYDTNGNLIASIYQNYFATSWTNFFRILYSWQEFSTGVNAIDNNTRSYSLLDNYPNPFNPSTQINFSIAKQGSVSLKIYDLLGRNIATLLNEEKPAGHYTVEWNAEGYMSGIYFYQLTSGNYTQIKKMVLIK